MFIMPPISVFALRSESQAIYLLEPAKATESGLSAKTVRTALRLLEEAAGYKGPLGRRPPARAKQLVPFRTVQ